MLEPRSDNATSPDFPPKNAPLPQFPSHSGCTRCILHAGVRRHGGIPTVLLPASQHASDTCVVFVGINPGVEEDRVGEPFVGPSGQRLRALYIEGGGLLPHCSIYLTNACRCGPEVDHVSMATMKACWPYLLDDLTLIASRHSRRALVALGRQPSEIISKMLFGKTATLTALMTKMPRLVSIADQPWHLFATYHPAFLMRQGHAIHPIADHMQVLSNWYHGTAPSPSIPRLVPPGPP